MAYYKDAPKQHTSRRNYANEGSWDDEGTHYRGANRRFGPESGYTQKNGAGEHRRPRPEGEQKRFEDRGEHRRFDAPGRPSRGEGRGYGERRYFEHRGPREDRPRRFDDRPVREDRPQRFERPMMQEDRPAPSYRDFEHHAAPVPPMDQPQENLPPENLLAGRNPIREALKSGRDLEKLLVQRGELSGSAREIVQMAKEKHIPVQEVEKSRLDEIAPHHQGMLAFASAYAYATVEDMLEEAAAKEEEPFLILLDGVTDPHNLGAIIRSAECAGAHGVIVPERRSVGLTPAAVKASAGAVEHCKVARVTNLNRTIEDLKKRGIWTYAVTMDGEDYEQVNFKGGVALVIGSEGEGISRLTLESCDQKVSLPLVGEIDSLNASVAAGIMMYRVLSVRRK